MTISVTVTISSVYPGPSGGAVFSGRENTGRLLRFVASRDHICRAPFVGETWALRGESRSHPRYGDQVHVHRASPVEPEGALIISFLSRHPAFNGLGIGKVKAAKLWAELGQRLPAALAGGDITALSAVLPEHIAASLVETWRSVMDEANVIAFLDQHGFDLRLANKLRAVWPEGTVAKLHGNPYRMLAFANWERVDHVARLLGVAEDDPRRRVAAVEAFLYRRLDAKHTLTPRATLLDGVRSYLCAHSLNEADAAVEQARNANAIALTGDGYQPLGAAAMERIVADRLRKIAGGAPGSARNLFSRNLASIAPETIAAYESATRLKLNAGQKAAVRAWPSTSPSAY